MRQALLAKATLMGGGPMLKCPLHNFVFRLSDGGRHQLSGLSAKGLRNQRRRRKAVGQGCTAKLILEANGASRSKPYPGWCFTDDVKAFLTR